MKKNDKPVVGVATMTYPRHCRRRIGEVYFVVFVDETRVGGFDMDERGYVPFGCRKPLKTREQAARMVIRRAIRSGLQTTARLSAAWDAPITFDSESILD